MTATPAGRRRLQEADVCTGTTKIGCAAVWLLLVVCSGRTKALVAPDAATLTIEVRDYAFVASVPMTAAVARAQTIFDRAAVPIRITVERRTARSEDRARDGVPIAAVTVLIYPRVRDEQVAGDGHVLGSVPGAASGGRIAYVFASRVEDQATHYGIDYGLLLGTVLAHEMGHVLLRGRPHAQVGLMRAVCDAQQIRNAILGTLEFTPEETTIIKQGMF